MILRPLQIDLLQLLVKRHAETGSYPTLAVIAGELHVERTAVPAMLKRLEELGAIRIDPRNGAGREAVSYARRLHVLIDEETIALGGAEQPMLFA